MSKVKYPKSAVVAQPELKGQPSFITWIDGDEASRKYAFNESAKALDEYSAVAHYRGDRPGNYINDFSNILPGIHARPGFTRSTYDYFRPEEASPSRKKEIFLKCDIIYKNEGLIRNIIDLMGDFACQGIRLTHPNKRIEKFYNNWFQKVSGQERSERFLNYLYRLGNVVIRKRTAKINVKTEDKLYKTYATSDINLNNVNTIIPDKREIPWQYTFLHPATISVVGGALSSFVGDKLYAIEVPMHIKRTILSPRTPEEQKIVEQLPADIKAAAKNNKPYILPPEKTLVYHYKKDDWEEWASPMLQAVLVDAVALGKLKLADISALDGAVSKIRIFKLGDLEHKVLPTAAASSKLSSVLQGNVGGGTIDLVWGPDIKIEETNTDQVEYLGQEKYVPVLNAIYAGLGFPSSLTSSGSKNSGTTNNFISLKTFIERLEYGRKILIEFWTHEILLVQKAMGFRFPAFIEFDFMSLGNEESVKKLYLDLHDRGIISDECIQNIFKQNPSMEKIRLNREAKERVNKKRTSRMGPYVEPEATQSLRKIALQSGVVSPREVGVQLDTKAPNDKSGMDFKNEQLNNINQMKVLQQKNTKGVGGRPRNSLDSIKRKTKTFKPQAKASLFIWTHNAQAKISEILHPIILGYFNKKNLRMLSNTEAKQLEDIKFGVLSNIEPLSDIDVNIVISALYKDTVPEIAGLYKDYVISSGKELVLNDEKYLQALAYNNYYIGE